MCTRFFLILIAAFICSQRAVAQYENVWIFANAAGLDFNSGSPVAIPSSSAAREGNASVCNKSGQLLFYTEGSYIWDRNHNLMPGGNNLTPPLSGPIGASPTWSCSQAAVIVPMPDSQHKYYVFSLTAFEFTPQSCRLYYSVVNMNLNGGLGDVEPGQKGILLDTALQEKLTAVVGDRCNVWLLTLSTAGKFKAREINSSGLAASQIISAVGMGNGVNAGVIAVSPDRHKIATVDHATLAGTPGVGVFDFDPVTGIASGGVLLAPFIGTAYGVCFSPDNSKLYATGPGEIYQFNLAAGSPAAIAASQTIISYGQSHHLKLAPDGKIYFRYRHPFLPYPSGTALAAIKQPNLPGTACQVDSLALMLAPGASLSMGFPNVIARVQKDTLHKRVQPPACFKDSLVLGISTDAWDVQWYNGNNAFTHTIHSSGTYTVSYYTPPCVYHKDTFDVALYPLPQLQATVGCRDDSNALAVVSPLPGSLLYTYTWRNQAGQVVRGPLQSSTNDSLQHLHPGVYSLQIGIGGCDTVLKFTISPAVYQAGFRPDTVICLGTPLSFQNTSTGGFSSYQWAFGDGGTSTLAAPQHTYAAPGRYVVRLTATTNLPCRDTAYRTVVVDSLFSARFRTDRDSLCAGGAVVFTPTGDSTVARLEWSFGDGGGVLHARPGAVQHAYDTPGIMPVHMLMHFRACPASAYTDTVRVWPFPVVNLGPDTSLCLYGAPLQLAPGHPGLPGYRYAWSTGDISRSILVRHPGTYRLQITTEHGCDASDELIVHKGCYIDIPNAFTPNGDGVNDYFFPRQLLAHALSAFRMQVFNRWGQQVFETTRTDGRGWDGRLNNEPQPAGVYVYLIEATIGGQPERYQGNVSLLR